MPYASRCAPARRGQETKLWNVPSGATFPAENTDEDVVESTSRYAKKGRACARPSRGFQE